jgi:serine/threonine protein kinase
MQGHNHAVDYWALGVLTYEMVSGTPPFFAENAMELYENIVAGNYTIPGTFSRKLTDLIRRLLRSHQSKRLGNTKGGASAVMKHKWFSGFDWDGLLHMELEAPIIPALTGPDDTRNFEAFPDDTQLSVSKQRMQALLAFMLKLP